MSVVEETILTEDVTEAESAPESPVKEPQDIVEKAIVTEEVTEAQAAQESPVKDGPDAIVEDAVVTEKLQKLKQLQNHQSKKNLRLLWRKPL